MNHTVASFNSSSTEDSLKHGVVAKLRRLKIQESLCIKNINKIDSGETCEDAADFPVFHGLKFKHFSTRIKNAYTEINDLFEDIKAETEEKLDGLDIDNMKKDVITLDDKIRTFKNNLQSELTSLLSQEEELSRPVNEVEEISQTRKLVTKIKMKPFNNIIPSPVKVLIKSPFKCKEVQEFQKFMMNSPNRYGGWNEYHHNIFVQVWQKYVNPDVEVGNISNNDAFQNEILQKVTGPTKEDIIRHGEWYAKYLYLKEQQRNALNNWRNSKPRLGKAQNKYQGNQKKLLHKRSFDLNMTSRTENEAIMNPDIVKKDHARDITGSPCSCSPLQSLQNIEPSRVEIVPSSSVTIATDHSSRNMKLKQSKRSFSDILKPTKQWSNRCNSLRDSMNGIHNIEYLTKLRVPDWRLGLLN